MRLIKTAYLSRRAVQTDRIVATQSTIFLVFSVLNDECTHDPERNIHFLSVNSYMFSAGASLFGWTP